MKWAERISAPLRVMLVLILVPVALAGAGTALLLRSYSEQVNNEIERMCGESADAYAQDVERRLGNYSLAMEMIGLNQTIRESIFRTDVTRFEMVELGGQLDRQIADLTYYLYQSGEIYSHCLYTPLPGDGGYFRDLSSSASEPWFEEAAEAGSASCYEQSRVTGSALLTLARRIDSEDGQSCFQTLTVDSRRLFRPQEANLSPDIYVFHESDGEMILGGPQEEEARACYASGGGTFGNGDGIAVLRRFDAIGAAALLHYPLSPLSGYGVNTRQLVTVVAVALVLVVLVLLFLFYIIFTRRMDLLVAKMDRFDEKDVQPVYPMGGRDEIARMDRHLIKMQNRILYLIQEEYIAKMQNIEAQHQALVACINPHFLYNTLNTISSMANLEGADDTVQMVEALGSMFRYSSAVTEKTVPLESELGNISDYLYLQQIRHRDGFTAAVEASPEAKAALVPKLILQPLVENAFKHAFKGRRGFTAGGEPRRLEIRARIEGRFLYVDVRDNGCGMSGDRLEEVRRSLDAPDSPGQGSIGLKNVHRRIRMLYGEASGLEVESKEGCGACITVRTALRGEALENGKNSDRGR